MIKVFYHDSDLDGFCSGAIIKHKYPTCETIGINYGQEFPWDTIRKADVVYMVDFSLPMADMERLNNTCQLVWIDHHISAINAYKKSGIKIKGMSSVGIGACALVWDYCYPYSIMPEAVQLLAEYDVWDHENPKTVPFQYGMRLEKALPGVDVWSDLLVKRDPFTTPGPVEDICENGKIVLEYENQSNEMYMKASFDVFFEGMKFITANKLYTNSQVFDSVWDNKKYHAMLTFGWVGDCWRCSMYTDREGVDVSKIAVKHGGGGHKQAAGFTCDYLPFDITRGKK